MFLLSLKAGDLTAADLFLLGPWWNPAVEAQTIEIGQGRPVTAYERATRTVASCADRKFR